MNIYLYVYIYIYIVYTYNTIPPARPAVCPSARPPVRPSTCPPVRPSTRLPIARPSARPPVCLSARPPVHLCALPRVRPPMRKAINKYIKNMEYNMMNIGNTILDRHATPDCKSKNYSATGNIMRAALVDGVSLAPAHIIDIMYIKRIYI